MPRKYDLDNKGGVLRFTGPDWALKTQALRLGRQQINVRLCPDRPPAPPIRFL
jgi:hypothetical protein